MLFNSWDYAIFLPCVFIIYWLLLGKKQSYQNVFIVVSSYLFYACWDWRFLSLIIISTITDFNIAQAIFQSKSDKIKTRLLGLSLLVNIGILATFKYFNFFIETFVDFYGYLGGNIRINHLNIILPVGISFYTFQTLSYTFDVYYEKIEPTNNLITYAAFVSFFPQLLAGPIERATQLIPQYNKIRVFKYEQAISGCKQILWGLFKKIVIADNAAVFVNDIFNQSNSYQSTTLILGVILYAFQIYGDFSGYSDVAIGSARLLGIELSQNFLFPYFSRNIGEFWRRWHISLTSWLNDYIYLPMAFSLRRLGKWGVFVSVFVVFVLSGFWHGAQGHFVFWGAYWGVLFLPIVFQKNAQNPFSKRHVNRVELKEIHHVLFTFSFVCLGALFFRVDSMNQAIGIIERIINPHLWGFPEVRPTNFLMILALFLIVEWQGRTSQFGIEKWGLKWPKALRWLFYYSIIFLIFWWSGNQQEFIYFQF